MNYDWMSLIVFVLGLISLSIVAQKIAFQVPALRRMRDINSEQDEIKRSTEKYPPIMKENGKSAFLSHILFLTCIAPFLMTLDSLPIWRYIIDIVIVLVIYDFFYYLTHRFLFHGPGFFKRIHGVHHQARNPTFIDAQYVHPLETALAISLLSMTIIGYFFCFGSIHVASMVFIYFIYINMNTLNHAYFDLDYFPFKTVNYLTTKHQIHHINMRSGNYASMLPLYDYLFGTLE